MGKWAIHLRRDKTLSKRMGREYREGEGRRKLERDQQRELGARQVETLREFIQGNSSGSWNNAMREEVEAVSRAM